MKRSYIKLFIFCTVLVTCAIIMVLRRDSITGGTAENVVKVYGQPDLISHDLSISEDAETGFVSVIILGARPPSLFDHDPIALYNKIVFFTSSDGLRKEIRFWKDENADFKGKLENGYYSRRSLTKESLRAVRISTSGQVTSDDQIDFDAVKITP